MHTEEKIKAVFWSAVAVGAFSLLAMNGSDESQEAERVAALQQIADTECDYTPEIAAMTFDEKKSFDQQLATDCHESAEIALSRLEDEDYFRPTGSWSLLARWLSHPIDGDAHFESVSENIDADVQRLLPQMRAARLARLEEQEALREAYAEIRAAVEATTIRGIEMFNNAEIQLELQSLQIHDGVRVGSFGVTTTDAGTSFTNTFTYNHITGRGTQPEGTSTTDFEFFISGYVSSFLSSGETSLSGSGRARTNYNGALRCLNREDRGEAGCTVAVAVLDAFNRLDQRHFDILVRDIREKTEGDYVEDQYGYHTRRRDDHISSTPTFPVLRITL
ncbi:MAG: hypothetical protein GC136_02995 [Alphaproteobacteria bacterium]|nr:hypothetical protein [Alphaproteobacteria bacterium]